MNGELRDFLRRGHISERVPPHVRNELRRSLLNRQNGNGHTKLVADEERKNGKRAPRPFAPRSPEGDPERLRGIPVVGNRIAGGAVKDTRPDVVVPERLDRLMAQRERVVLPERDDDHARPEEEGCEE